MQVRGARGVVLATVLGLAVLPPLVPDALGVDLPGVVVDVPAAAGRLLLVRYVGTGPVVVDTTALTGPELRGWWADGVTGETVDAGSVPRGTAVALNPPDTGDTAAHDWTLVIVDATRGLVPPS
jgi:hypothetical protein